MPGARRASRHSAWMFHSACAVALTVAPHLANANVPTNTVQIAVETNNSNNTIEAPRAESTQIRVRLEHIKSSFTLSGIHMRYPGAVESSHVSTDSGLKHLRVDWQNQASGKRLWMIYDRDANQLVARFISDKIDISGEMMRANLKPVPDHLTAMVGRGAASTDLIAQMDLESYVHGVLPAEMPHDWPVEALKAQAIAARSFALFRMNESARMARGYDVETDVMDQVFLMPTHQHLEKVDVAMRDTRGITLKDTHGQAFAAYFHADCGGQTEEAKNVWGIGEKQGVVKDSGCPLSPLAKWQTTIGQSELALRLAKYLPSLNVNPIKLKVLTRTSSGRVEKILIAWNSSEGSARQSVMSGNDFRQALGFDRLRSTNFDLVERIDQSFEMNGRGYGHGVGLCQWGARHLALQGKSYREILAHYYPRSRLVE